MNKLNDIKILDFKKMSNYSVSEGTEIENLLFFYYCCQTSFVKDRLGRYQDSKNVRCFDTYEEAKNYINNLESEDGWIKRIDEYFVEKDFASLNVFDNVYAEYDFVFEDDSFCFLHDYSFINKY